MSESGSHLDDDTLIDLIEGRVDDAMRARIESHAAGCVLCRKLLSAIAQQTGSAATVPEGKHARRSAPAVGDTAEGRVGRYELTRLLGAGGMGVVFAAHDPELDRTVAVKLLRSDAAADTSRLVMEERLRREAQAMARISHPNVVAVYDVGTIGDRVFVAMEYVEGVTLADWLETGRDLTEILDAFGAAGRGLAAAHAQGLVHRDFKPKNVLVGNDGRVRVTDFGIAKSLPPAGAPSQPRALALSATNAAMGTPYYMAPEQFLGEPVDARTDQFSFCVALYAAVHGVLPFAGTTFEQLAATIIDHNITPPPASRPVPPAIAAAILRGLASAPSERFASMDDLLAALAIAPPPRRARRMMAWIGGATAAILGTVALAIAYSGAREAAPPPIAAAPAPQRELALPMFVTIPRVRGPARQPSYVEPAGPDQLGSDVFGSTWCPARKAAVLVTAYGRVATVTPEGAVTTLGTFPGTPRGNGAAVACLPSGRIVGIVRGTPFVLDGSVAVAPAPAPAPAVGDVVAAVAVGDTVRWAAPGAIWEWSGTTPARRLRASCSRPLALSHDGEAVACADGTHIVVDRGGQVIKGPDGASAVWSRDDRALYVVSAGVVRRWAPGARGDAELLTSGSDPIEIGPWLVTKQRAELVHRWIGAGSAPALPLIDLGPGAEVAKLVAALPPDRVVVAYRAQGIRVISLRHPPVQAPPDRHAAGIFALAFSTDGTTLYSADAQSVVLARAPSAGTPHRVGAYPDFTDVDLTLVARADHTLVAGNRRMIGAWDVTGRFAPWPLTDLTGPVLGTDDLVRASLRDGIAVLGSSGQTGALLMSGPLPRGLMGVAVDHARHHALLRVGTDRVELHAVGSGELELAVNVPGRTTQRVALAGGEPFTIVFADTSGQVFAASAAGVVPIVKLSNPITALAASPVDRRVAVGDDREVVVIDLDRRAEVATGAVDSTVTALVWSRDGRQLAAAAASTELAIWRF